MPGPNGATAPNDAATPEPVLSDVAIDAVIDSGDQPVIGDDTHKLAQKYAELEQQLKAKDEVIARRDRDFAALQEANNKHNEMLSELVGGMRDAKDRGYYYEREQLEAIQRKATAEADLATFDQAAHALRLLEQRRFSADQKPATLAQPAVNPTGQQLPPPDPVAAAWVAENPWINVDPELFEFAIMQERRLGASYPDTATRLAKVKENVVKRFPEKFPNAARQQPSTVSRPGSQVVAGRPRQKEKTVADLPADAKLALDRIKRRDPSFTDQDYIKSYKWD